MTDRRLALALFVLSVTSVAPCLVAALAADLIVTNARIHTVDESQPVIEAMAIRKGPATYVGGRAVYREPIQ